MAMNLEKLSEGSWNRSFNSHQKGRAIGRYLSVRKGLGVAPRVQGDCPWKQFVHFTRLDWWSSRQKVASHRASASHSASGRPEAINARWHSKEDTNITSWRDSFLSFLFWFLGLVTWKCFVWLGLWSKRISFPWNAYGIFHSVVCNTNRCTVVTMHRRSWLLMSYFL